MHALPVSHQRRRLRQAAIRRSRSRGSHNAASVRCAGRPRQSRYSRSGNSLWRRRRPGAAQERRLPAGGRLGRRQGAGERSGVAAAAVRRRRAALRPLLLLLVLVVVARCRLAVLLALAGLLPVLLLLLLALRLPALLRLRALLLRCQHRPTSRLLRQLLLLALRLPALLRLLAPLLLPAVRRRRCASRRPLLLWPQRRCRRRASALVRRAPL